MLGCTRRTCSLVCYRTSLRTFLVSSSFGRIHRGHGRLKQRRLYCQCSCNWGMPRSTTSNHDTLPLLVHSCFHTFLGTAPLEFWAVREEHAVWCGIAQLSALLLVSSSFGRIHREPWRLEQRRFYCQCSCSWGLLFLKNHVG